MADGGGSTVLARVGLVALTVAPPGALAAVNPSAVARHPVLAACALVGYEVLVVLTGFAGKVFGELQGRWVTRVADAVDRWLQRRTSRFEQSYRRHVRSTHRFVDLKGLATRGDYTPGLEEVFVDVSVAPGPVHTAEREPLAGAVPGPGARQSIDAFLGEEQGACLALIGAPGTGKTTLLKHLALRLADRSHGRGERPRRDLPVLLYLRDHAEAITADASLTLPQVIAASVGGLEPPEPEGWFEEQLRDGRCLVLLDGLDEVAREEDRRHVSAWAERQIERYERSDFVLTSRPHGYRTAPLNRARVLQVRRFTGEQISRFLHGWYRTIERLSTGVHDAGVENRAAAEAEDLIRRLRDRSMLYDLAANPLLLTMIANVHRYRGALPGSRAELYAEICQVLLWRRAEAKNVATVADEVPGAKKEVVLRELAYTMMAEGRRDIAAGQAAELLAPALARVAATTAPDAFLASVVTSGLLVEREHGLYAFAHLTLQEHLAALHIQHHRLVDTLVAGIDADWWRETTLLYAARTDPAPVVDACLEANTTRTLALAFDCEEQATELSPVTAERLAILRLQFLAEPPGSPRRRLMTAVTVTRQLRDTIRLNDDAQVTVRPVTRELYALFSGKPAGERPTDPAVGITRTEAVELVTWINGLLPEGTTVRLPTYAEVTDPAFTLTSRSPEHSVWHAAMESGVPPGLWVPDGLPHPWSGGTSVPEGLDLVALTATLARVRGLHDDEFTAPDYDPDATIALTLALARNLDRAVRLGLDHVDGLYVDLRDVLSVIGPFQHADGRLYRAARVAADRLAGDAQDGSEVLPAAREIADVVAARLTDLPLAHGMALEILLATGYAPAPAPAPLSGVIARSRAIADDLDRLYPAPPAETDLLEAAFSANRLLWWLMVGEPDPPPRDRRRPRASDSSVADPLSAQMRQLLTVYDDEITPTLEEAVAHTPTSDNRPKYGGVLMSRLARQLESLARSLPDPDTGEGLWRVHVAHMEGVAFTLAAVADDDDFAPALAALYRRVGAGLQVLRHRAEGRITPTETLILIRT
ncbi:NACHT domain-containing protein [Streptomyces sp. NPDC001833]|uniref:NACHT domain-containing protein n=1 Tax=Streptomyces sp. NPDC001833 TaxID=3154658 RepID=UPI0033317D0A